MLAVRVKPALTYFLHGCFLDLNHRAAGFDAAFTGTGAFFAMGVCMFRALSCTHVASFGAKLANFFHARTITRHTWNAQTAYFRALQVKRNAVGERLYVRLFKTSRDALQARYSTGIAGFQTCFLHLIHHFKTPVKVTPIIWDFMIELFGKNVCATTHTAADYYLAFIFTPAKC